MPQRKQPTRGSTPSDSKPSVQVVDYHTNQGVKPVLIKRERRLVHICVGYVGSGVTHFTRPMSELSYMKPTMYKGKEYPVGRFKTHLRTLGRRYGMTKGARQFLK